MACRLLLDQSPEMQCIPHLKEMTVVFESQLHALKIKFIIAPTSDIAGISVVDSGFIVLPNLCHLPSVSGRLCCVFSGASGSHPYSGNLPTVVNRLPLNRSATASRSSAVDRGCPSIRSLLCPTPSPFYRHLYHLSALRPVSSVSTGSVRARVSQRVRVCVRVCVRERPSVFFSTRSASTD